jgi:NADPH:quinone reductase-like Zn-dependent oxidoreductase
MGGKVELESVVGLVLQGAFTPRLDAVLPLGETRTGHEALEERRHVGKIVIDVRARPD